MKADIRRAPVEAKKHVAGYSDSRIQFIAGIKLSADDRAHVFNVK
ncbi:MAG: hypothetical protein ABR974_03630 [Bacteroidales bacterium]